MEGLPREEQEALLNVAFEGALKKELLAAGRLIGQLCTQLWQECFEADAKDDSTRRPPEGHAV